MDNIHPLLSKDVDTNIFINKIQNRIKYTYQIKKILNKTFLKALSNLEAYCESENFKGYDPYDGLNSSVFQAIPLIPKSRIARIIWIQLLRRLPINLRRLVKIKKEYNPKALGLFLSAYCQLYSKNPRKEYLERIYFFIEKIYSTINLKYSGACWGYNFDWQARAFYQPRNTPTVVSSVFIASALLDAYEIINEESLLKTARSTCNFILKDLNRTFDNNGNFSFSYSPLDKSVVFNASLLGSRLLSRVYSFTHEIQLIEEAKKSVAFSISHQKENGSWSYGALPFHQWVDNFHTGYNLECISDYIKFSGDSSFEIQLNKGFKYYIETFFTEDGIACYYNNSKYPIDIHSISQMIITLIKLNKLEHHKDLADKVLNWTIINMQSKRGFFYFQINKHFSSKISYMRWAQAWMFYALSTYLKSSSFEQN